MSGGRPNGSVLLGCPLFVHFTQDLVEQFVRRLAVGVVIIVGVEVIGAVFAPNFFGQIILGNVDALRIRAGARPSLAPFLYLHLPFARQQPVDENFSGIWMRRVLHQTQRAARGAQRATFFQIENLTDG